ncbi:hypothetical protein QYE76_054516 [Lolium multiflorum]|uniref:Uncharacterized protein n=1 Tax=Lolium multiflorum TaxID=4521 RepID=A0AAD8SY67_LOLMU|nr:hypothetical protein QYE76_054516 [Lolium multiflorum]
MTFMLRPGRMYPPHDSHESVRWNAGWFYEKNVSVPEIHDGLPKFNNEPPEELSQLELHPAAFPNSNCGEGSAENLWRFKTLVKVGGQPIPELIKDIYTNDQCPPLATLAEENLRTILRVPVSGDTAEEVPEDEEEEEEPRKVAPRLRSVPAPRPEPAARPPPRSPRTAALHYELHKNIAQRRVTLGQAENIRTLTDKNAANKMADAKAHLPPRLRPPPNGKPALLLPRTGDKLKEAERRRSVPRAVAEKNSELIREKGEFALKRNADSETIKRQQKELNGLRKYMETAEHHWDLLAENILEPLGYPEKRRNKFPRDDVLSLAGDDCKDLISASRKICHNLSLKRSRTCSLRKLIKRMDILPELVTDLQASSARGAAAMTLTMCLAHNPKMDLDRVSSGVPPTADVGKLLDAVSGYDTRIARRIRHEEFYDKVVLPADEPLEDELQKERDAEARPAESGTSSPGPAPRMLPKRKSPRPALQPPTKMKRAMKMCRLRLSAPKEKIRRQLLLRPRRSENVYVLRDKTMHHFGPSEGL